MSIRKETVFTFIFALCWMYTWVASVFTFTLFSSLRPFFTSHKNKILKWLLLSHNATLQQPSMIFQVIFWTLVSSDPSKSFICSLYFHLLNILHRVSYLASLNLLHVEMINCKSFVYPFLSLVPSLPCSLLPNVLITHCYSTLMPSYCKV